jgi:hypothetical protein
MLCPQLKSLDNTPAYWFHGFWSKTIWPRDIGLIQCLALTQSFGRQTFGRQTFGRRNVWLKVVMAIVKTTVDRLDAF